MNLVPPWSGCKGYRVKSLAAAVLLVLAAAASHPALMAQTPAPVIEKLKPTSGPVGTNVKIKGSNFGTSPGTVTFNGTNAPVNPSSNWESDKIQVKVPEGATDGPVVVTTSGGQSSAGVAFTVTISAPVIERLKPASGPVGTNVKIKGSSFGTSPGTVTFNGTNAPVNPDGNWESDKIQVKVPEGATDGPVVVRTSGGQSSAGATFDVTIPAPVVSRLDPSSGLVNSSVTIEGSNFGSSSGTVTFNGTTASTTSWASDEIQTKVPSGATTGPVVVRTSGGKVPASLSP